jgi:chemotaxis signal transduction protein
VEDDVLVVQVGPFWLGCPIRCVTEILPTPRIVRVPSTPAMLRGVSMVRGQPLAVWSIAPLLGLPLQEVRLAVRWSTRSGAALLAVDEVDRLLHVEFSQKEDAWKGLVPEPIQPLLSGAALVSDEWLWRLTEDAVEQLQAMAVQAVRGEGSIRASS